MAGCWWLTPVILATQEAEISRTAVGAKSSIRPYYKNSHHKEKKELKVWIFFSPRIDAFRY
jgi:hypothetical protein